VAGKPDAQVLMAQRYAEGDRVPKNITAAMEWYMYVCAIDCGPECLNVIGLMMSHLVG
jgi:TPR repeat protein